MLVGGGTSSRDAGEIWHLFDTRYNIPITMVDVNNFARLNLSNYNTIILPGGSYSAIGKTGAVKLSEWIQDGGNLIAYKNANQWISSQKMIDIKFKRSAQIDSSITANYLNMRKLRSIHTISGAIFEVKLDLTHPLAYGYHNNTIPVFKSSSSAVVPSINTLSSPMNYFSDPLISGYASTENQNRIKNTPFLMIHSSGRGKIVSILDNTNFRGVWYGTNKIFANSVFFGPIISRGYSRYEEDVNE